MKTHACGITISPRALCSELAPLGLIVDDASVKATDRESGRDPSSGLVGVLQLATLSFRFSYATLDGSIPSNTTPHQIEEFLFSIGDVQRVRLDALAGVAEVCFTTEIETLDAFD